MTPEDHAAQLSLVRAAEGHEAQHDVYPLRARETDRTGPPAPLFDGAAFAQIRGQLPMDITPRGPVMRMQRVNGRNPYRMRDLDA